MAANPTSLEDRLIPMILHPRATDETHMTFTMTPTSLLRDYELNRAPTGPMMTKNSRWTSLGSLVTFSVQSHKKEETRGQELLIDQKLEMQQAKNKRVNIRTHQACLASH